MADGSVIFSTELDSGGLSSGLAGIGKVAKGAGSTFVKGFKGVSVALGAVTTGMGFLAKTAVKYNSSMENYATNFGVMLGDEAKAVEHVAELRDMAAKTPFGTEELADASQTMLSFGVDAERSMEAMQQLGDISLGNKQRFSALSLAFSQVASAGKLTGQDLLQMINAGFNPLQTIAEKTGTNLGDLKEVMAGKKGSKEFRKQLQDARKEVKKMGDQASEGAKMLAQIGEEGMISAEMLGWAMEIETSPGGRFYNGMLKASETFTGMVSTLQDDAMSFVGSIFEPMTDKLSKVAMPLAQRYLGALTAAFNEDGVAGLAEAVGTVISDATTRVSEKLPDVLSIATGIITSIATGLTDNADKITSGITGAITAIATSDLPETAITSIGTFGMTLVRKLAESLSENSGAIIGGISSGINKLIEGGLVGDLLTSAVNLGTGLIKGIAENLPATLPSIAKGIVDGIGAAFDSLPDIVKAGGKLLAGIKKGLFGEGETAGAIDVLGQTIVEKINSALSIFDGTSISFTIPDFEEIKQACQKLYDAIVDFFTIKITIEPPGSPGSSQSETDKGIQEIGTSEADYLKQQYEAARKQMLETWEQEENAPSFSLFDLLVPKAGAAEVPEELLTGMAQTANLAADEMQQQLLAAFQSGQITYDQLVSSIFPETDGSAENAEMAEGGESKFSGLAQNLITDLSMALQNNGSLVSSALSIVLSTAKSSANTGQFSSVGAQIAGGIAKGINNGTGVVVAAVKRLIKAALKAAEEAAQINSPSRLFRDTIGLGIAEGTAVGVDKNAYMLRKSVNDMVLNGVPGMKKMGTSLAASYAPRNMSAVVERASMAMPFNQTNNFNIPVQTPDEFANTMKLYATYGLQAKG